MAQLRQHHHELAQLNTQVLIISFGTPRSALAWLDETGVPFPMLLDPERIVYQAYGLERSLLRSWNLRTAWLYARLLFSGRKWRGIQGDSAQLGGDVIVDAEGILRFTYRSRDPTDRPALEVLLNVLTQCQRGD